MQRLTTRFLLKDERTPREVVKQIAEALGIGIGVAEHLKEKEREFITLEEIVNYERLRGKE